MHALFQFKKKKKKHIRFFVVVVVDVDDDVIVAAVVFVTIKNLYLRTIKRLVNFFLPRRTCAMRCEY